MCAPEAADDSAAGPAAGSPRTLLLLRHATADTPPGTPDRRRPLSTHGRAEAAAVGQWLAEQHGTGQWSPIATVLCSPALRTRQTLQGLGLDLGVEVGTDVDLDVDAALVEDLYGGGVPDIVSAVAAAPATSRTVLVVGHSPGIPSAAVDLDRIAADRGAAAANRPVLQRFPPAALAVLQTTDDWSELPERGAALVRVRLP